MKDLADRSIYEYQIIRYPDHNVLAIEDNGGLSVTNNIEKIIEKIKKEEGIKFDFVVY